MTDSSQPQRAFRSPLPQYAPPRWVTWYVRALSVLLIPLEFLSKHRLIAVVLAGLTLSMTCLASDLALANANTIPERKVSLCEFLGYAAGCKIKWETGKFGTAKVEMAVDEHVGDPDGPGTPSTRVGTMRVTLENMNGHYPDPQPVVMQNFQRVLIDGPWGWWWMGVSAPPCMSPDQSKLADADQEGTYSCLTEEQLAGDPAHVAGMIPWVRADWPLLDKIRKLHVARGIPIPVATLGAPEVEDERLSLLPTAFKVGIVYAFALPAPGWVEPSSEVPPSE